MRVLRAFLCGAALTGAIAVPTRAQTPPPTEIRVRLSKDTVIAGVRCGPTGRAYAVLFADGALNECPLAADTVIAGHAVPRGTWILLDPARTLRSGWLPRDTDLQGIPCKGNGYKSWHVRFRPDGRLQDCFLSREATIDGVPCKSASFLTELTGSTQVSVHPNGRLWSCRVARDVARNGITVPRGERITLTDAGAIVTGPAPPAR